MSLLFTICLLHFVAQLSPGPDVLLIAKSAASTTRQNALKVIAGISAGIVVWVVLTLAGFTVLIDQFPWIQQALMLLGGIFLAKMGWAMLKGGVHSFKNRHQTDEDTNGQVQAKNYFMLGLWTNLSNPKTLIYFSSVFSLALSSSASDYLKAQLAVIIPLQTFITFTLLMLLISQPKIKILYQRSGSYIDMMSGGLFLLFALWLWYEALILMN
ncbi:LysE family transporter [Acinetobacter lwoffii]|jgi:threonine efflux protein|uniref:Threonine efflux protein n=1 Tax=Acinetobacter lwoffii TaxID=28090 RepID=A0AAW3VHM2_ACILW|nr:LysE family transporter [Acinetobacter lwoffii]MBB6363976.1 threonine efflux protein [Acinetobacter lwoffii]MEB6680067.1 LysE family transporter [Acinetobacter lwoffii]QXX86832.1 LysE family transporter [Acinetobacter lwoffii]